MSQEGKEPVRHQAAQSEGYLGIVSDLSLRAASAVTYGVGEALNAAQAALQEAGIAGRKLIPPTESERLVVGTYPTELGPQLLHFRDTVLGDGQWQHGTSEGDGDPMLYLYMEKALRAYPRLRKYCTGLTSAALSDEELFSIPARDQWTAHGMYNRDSTPAGVVTAASLASGAPASPPSEPAPQLHTAPTSTAAWTASDAFDAAPRFGFAGAGWLIVYHVGAATAFRERWDLTQPDVRLAGTSAGAVVASICGAGTPFSDMLVRSFGEKYLDVGARVLGPVGRMGTLIQEAMANLTPEKAHEACSGRVRITVTTITPPLADSAVQQQPQGPTWLPGRRACITHYPDRQTICDAVVASCNIPVYMGVQSSLPQGLVHDADPDAWAPPSELAPTRLLALDGGAYDNVPRWGGAKEQADIDAGVAREGVPVTATVSPMPGCGTVSPGVAEACGAGPRPFDVKAQCGSGGWGPSQILFPSLPEQYWEIFFAGRAHAQAWMAQHGYSPRPRPSGE